MIDVCLSKVETRVSFYRTGAIVLCEIDPKEREGGLYASFISDRGATHRRAGICPDPEFDGRVRNVAVEEFVTGNHQNVLKPGELLRRIELPGSALRKRTSFRRMSLTHLGRSAVLLVGTLSPQDGVFMLTVSAATDRPHRLEFPRVPEADELAAKLEQEIPQFFDDVHGSPAYRKHITFHFAEEIRRELSGDKP